MGQHTRLSHLESANKFAVESVNLVLRAVYSSYWFRSRTIISRWLAGLESCQLSAIIISFATYFLPVWVVVLKADARAKGQVAEAAEGREAEEQSNEARQREEECWVVCAFLSAQSENFVPCSEKSNTSLGRNAAHTNEETAQTHDLNRLSASVQEGHHHVGNDHVGESIDEGDSDEG